MLIKRRSITLMLHGALLLLLGTGEALAQQRGNRPKRSPHHADRQAATAAAVARLRDATAPNWRVLEDTVVGTPLWADFTAGAGVVPAVLRVGSAQAAVATFLAQHGDLWGGRAALGSSLRPLSQKVDERGGVHFMYQQVYRAIDVEGAELGFFANRDRDGRYFIETVFGRFHPDIEIDVTPTLTAADARRRLIQAVGA